MKRIELSCPHPHCKAIIPIRHQEGEEYSGVYWCVCHGCKVRLEVGERVEIELAKESA